MHNATWKPKQRTQHELCLKQLCFHAVREHIATLDTKALLDLPVVLLEDLVPHLTVWQLNKLQPALNHRGISTLSGWVRVLQDINGPQQSIVLYTEEEAKHEAMRIIFTSRFYGFIDDFTGSTLHSDTPSFLWMAAACIKEFVLMAKCHKPLQRLAAGQRPLLELLEKRIQSVGISQSIDMSNRMSQISLYVLHRLLDHGRAEEVAVHVQCPMVLAWLLHRRGSQYVMPELDRNMLSCISQATSASTYTSCSEEHDVIPRKRSNIGSVLTEADKGKLTVDPQALCQTFAAYDVPSTKICPWGQIRRLKISRCSSDSLRLLSAALPTFFCLHSLTLHSFSNFKDTDVLDFARALKQLSESSLSSLRDLSIGILPYTSFLEILLNANPKVMSLHVEIQTLTCGQLPQKLFRSAESELPAMPLEKLTVKLAEIQTDLQVVISVLKRCPHLTSFHVAGMRPPGGFSLGQLLTTLSEVNLCLTSLSLEDMKLCDCLPAILTLLSNPKLEEVRFSDCRLFEKGTEKEDGLKQLVVALKNLPSLQTLSLAQNRLELFSGSSPSSVKLLDISSNFIKPADLLKFAKRLQTHRPPHRLTLDLRMNPGDRDPDTWNTALRKLHLFCVVLVGGWKSTDSMVDHVSNM
ncbi:leucine-rich repeat-containing protein 41 isoform X2 [Betta splendens]|uniref:Leucine-rich repeat-containing protein 41 n=1 Tax=Betta splendens TaxID=158456 RepID=A0A6P7M496_BETSP|nr:leucine-rich repeat-containing protein 41 isoform X2 [Betta splendens]